MAYVVTRETFGRAKAIKVRDTMATEVLAQVIDDAISNGEACIVCDELSDIHVLKFIDFEDCENIEVTELGV